MANNVVLRQHIPTAYALATICGPELAIAIARASQDQPPNKGPGPYEAGAMGPGPWGRPRNMAKPEIQNEKSCQGMPARSHLEPYVLKQDFPNFDKIWSKFLPGQPSHLALPCLAYLASHRPRSPCLHLAAPRNNSPAAEGGWAVVARCRQGERGRCEAR